MYLLNVEYKKTAEAVFEKRNCCHAVFLAFFFLGVAGTFSSFSSGS